MTPSPRPKFDRQHLGLSNGERFSGLKARFPPCQVFVAPFPAGIERVWFNVEDGVNRVVRWLQRIAMLQELVAGEHARATLFDPEHSRQSPTAVGTTPENSLPWPRFPDSRTVPAPARACL